MIIDDLKHARRIGVPIVAITTQDQPALVESLQTGLNGASPVICWDLIRSFRPLNQKGEEALRNLGAELEEFSNLVEALKACDRLPERSIVLLMNMHKFLDEPPVFQCVMNLRDSFKGSRRTLVMLGPDFRLPAELAQDILILDDPLPTPEAITSILTGLYGENGITHDAMLLERATGALRGLAAFPVEQAAALSVRPDKTVDLDELWQRKRRMIEQTRGLAMEKPGERFDDIGGSGNWKAFATQLFSGPRKPRVVVMIDEIEKAMAGSREDGPGDSSGVSQDQLGVMLSEMEDHNQAGAIFVGPPGGGKSMAAKATAASFDVPLIRLDLGAMKGSLVGQSEQNIRAAMKTIIAIAGEGGAFFVGTCNQMDKLPPALRRRFRFGVWFFDLPDAAERQGIGALHCARYNKTDLGFFRGQEGWSGANIRDCCELAFAMTCEMDEAASFIVPAATQDPTGLERLRSMANGRFLSAAYLGTYKLPSNFVETPATKIRKIGEVYEAETTPPAPTKIEKKRGN